MLGLDILLFLASGLFILTSADNTQLETDLPEGIMLSPSQETLDLEEVQGSITFSYFSVTIGDGTPNPFFDQQFSNCSGSGLYCGGYHIADPGSSSFAQVESFVQNGNTTSLPGLLVLGAYINVDFCYGLTSLAITNWIDEFTSFYRIKTNEYPVVVTTYAWWNECIGNDGKDRSNIPLWLVGNDDIIPLGWSRASFLQTDLPITSATSVSWNGTLASVAEFAAGVLDLGNGSNSCTTKGG